MSKYPKLDKYIKTARASGKTNDQLTVEMKSSGYSYEDIREVLNLPPLKESSPENTINKNNQPSENILNNKNKINYKVSSGKAKKLIFITGILLLITGALYFVWNSGLLSAAPYNQDNIFSGLAQNISKIETFSYSLSGSFEGQQRENDATVFESVGNNLEQKEKYYRDYQRAQFLRILTRNFKGNYPESLDLTVTELDFYDPLTKEPYVYEQIDNGNDFKLSIIFETSNAVSYAKQTNESYSLWSDQYTPIIIDEKKLTFTEDSVFSLPSKPPQNFYESMNEALNSIPDDINVNTIVDFKSNIEEENSDFIVDVFAEGDLGDLIYKIDANVIKKDENFYLKINNFPSLFLAFMPIPKEEWVSLNSDSLLSEYIPESKLLEDEEYKKELKKFYRKALILADKNNLINIINNPNKEKVSNESAFRYELEIKKDGIEPFLNDIITEVENGEYSNLSEILTDIENFQDYTNNEEFNNALNYYNKNTKNTLWVNNDGQIVKFESSNRLVPTADRLADKQFNLTLAIELNDINEEINIEAPDNYKTLDQIENTYSNVLQPARDNGADAMIKANLSTIRAQAELFYDSNNNSYGSKPFALGVCVAEVGTLFADQYINKSIESSSISEEKSPVCVSTISNNTVQSYAISAPLVTDSDYSFCIDSKGNAIEIIGDIKKDSCI